MLRNSTFNGLGKLMLLLVLCAAQVAAAPNWDPIHSISGRVADSGSNGIIDVTVSDGLGHTTSTDSNGDYTLSGLEAGTYVLTPTKAGYTFLPVSLEVTVPPDGTAQDFTAQEITYTISGNAGIDGALLSYFDGTAKSVLADGSGDYSLTVSYNWSGIVTPSKVGYSFSPINKNYSNVLADQPNENYNATQNEYTLTITSAHGTVGKNPNQATYHEGDVVELTAAADTGWSFTNWTGDLTSSVNPDSITIHGDTAVTANYTQNEYTLTVNSLHGTVVKSPNQATYHEGDVVELTAAADTGWSFANWTGDLTSSANPDSITIHGNTTVTANYTQNEYTLMVTSPHGTVVKNPDQATYHDGDVVQLTATPSTGWSFANWTGDLTGTVNPESITIHGDTTVTANYTQNEYTLTVNSLHGTVVKNPNQATYHHGDVVELTATADTGWSFANWTGDLTSSTNPDSVTIQGDTVITANYTINTYILNVSKTGTGSGTVTSNPAGINCGATCSNAYDYNTSVTLTAAASTGSTFTGWSGGGCSGTGTCVVTVTSATLVTANFTLQTPLFTVNKAGLGSGTVTSSPVGINCGSTCSHAFNYNTAVTLTANAPSGYFFAGWSGGGCTGTGTCSVTMTAALTVTANFSDIALPSVSWVGPVGDTLTYEVYNQMLQLQVNASDNVGISRVVYHRWDYVNLTSVEIGTVNTAPYTFSFNTSTLLPEWNQVLAEVYDTSNNVSSKYIWLKHLEMPVLSVNKTGSGQGKVTSSLAGISCGSDCSEPYAYDQVITLTPVAFAGSTFIGWSGGGCSGVGLCTITISSPLSVTATFSLVASVPALQSPRTNLLTSINTPTFWWMSGKGGQTYQIMFASNSSFTANVNSHTVNGPPYTVVSPLSDGKYYWRVRGYNDSNQPGGWSSTRNFTIDTAGPPAPVLSSPANNASSNRTPTFKWLSTPAAVLYEFQYDDSSNLLSPIYTLTVRGTFRRPPAMGIGIYYWRVRAKDAAGNWGAWSAPFSITIIKP